MQVLDPESEEGIRACAWHGRLFWFEWVDEVPGPVAIVVSLLHRGGSAQVYVREYALQRKYVFVVGATYRSVCAIIMLCDDQGAIGSRICRGS